MFILRMRADGGRLVGERELSQLMRQHLAGMLSMPNSSECANEVAT
jgi:hypothetical protein